MTVLIELGGTGSVAPYSVANAFAPGTGTVAVISASGTEVVLYNSDLDDRITLTGEGLSVIATNGTFTITGLVTGIEAQGVWQDFDGFYLVTRFRDVEMSGMAWDAEQTMAALRDLGGSDNSAGFEALLSLQPVVVDGRSSGTTVHVDFAGVTSNLTLFGYNDGDDDETELAYDDDDLRGGAGNDTVHAGDGSDTLRGGGGIDWLDYSDEGFAKGVRADLETGLARGLWGAEWAFFEESRFFYGYWETYTWWGRRPDFLQDIGGFENLRGTLVHGDILTGTKGPNVIEGLGGNDTIQADGLPHISYLLDEARQVYRLYQTTLDREPDTNGLLNWIPRVATHGLETVAMGFFDSREFQRVYGTLDDTQFVALLYQNVLDRAPDAEGLAYWVGRLDDGDRRAEIALGFSESREFVNRTLAAADAFIDLPVKDDRTDDVFRLYQATLDRAPDAAGFLDWLGRLDAGATVLSVIEGFMGSREFQNTYGAVDDAGFVTLLYQNVLDRAPDAAGLADWLGRLAGGMTRAEVVEGFAQSPEFMAATADDLTAFVRGLGVHDVIKGGAGDNRLWGGILADEFVFDADEDGTHRVMDFEAWDILRFQDFGYADAAAIRAHMVQAGADVVFQDQGVTVTLANVQLAAISDGNFALL